MFPSAKKKSSISRFDSYSVRNSVLIIFHITCTIRDCRVHFFSDNLSRNSCVNKKLNIARVTLRTKRPSAQGYALKKGKGSPML